MTSDDKKAAIFNKLKEQPQPLTTKVVPVEPAKPAKPAKSAATEKPEHMNAYIPPALAADMRMYKARSRTSLIDIINEAVAEYLDKRNALTK